MLHFVKFPGRKGELHYCIFVKSCVTDCSFNLCSLSDAEAWLVSVTIVMIVIQLLLFKCNIVYLVCEVVLVSDHCKQDTLLGCSSPVQAPVATLVSKCFIEY